MSENDQVTALNLPPLSPLPEKTQKYFDILWSILINDISLNQIKWEEQGSIYQILLQNISLSMKLHHFMNR